MSVLPEYKWEVWKFKRVYKDFWDEIKNQRQFFDSLFKELGKYLFISALILGLESLESWYNVEPSFLYQRAYGSNFFLVLSSAVLLKYNFDLYKLFSSVYPEYNWKAWSFQKELNWRNLEIRKKFLDELALQLNIQNPNDWYLLDTTAISEVCFHFHSNLFRMEEEA